MIIVNLFGGPGAGKTTVAYYLAYRFKQAGFRAELVGEAARELIYDRNPGITAVQLLDNQLLISGLQYERFKRLERHGIEVAIADSPLSMGLAYAAHLPEYRGLCDTVYRIERGLPKPINVFINRTPGVYDKESRAQDEKQAMALDANIRELLGHFDYDLVWGQECSFADALIEEVKRGWN
jgi:adenylate kinase family enzyme